jgi:uncharacterized repeat protein (TIGR03803 family)
MKMFQILEWIILMVFVFVLAACGGGGGVATNAANDTSYMISLAATPDTAGGVVGGGSYTLGSTVTVIASPNDGFSFVNWTESGQQVSTNATYTFTATSARTLVANFDSALYTVGGTVSGLSGTLVLRNNGGDDQIISADGGFVFSKLLANGSSYDVTIHSQPADLVCSVNQGSGTVNISDVTNVTVSCTATSATSATSCTDYSNTQPPVTQTESYLTLYDFYLNSSTAPYGSSPEAPLVEGPDGNFYGVTRYGGVDQYGNKAKGIVFRLTPDGTHTVLHTFEYLGGTDLHGIEPVGGLVIGSDCALYGTTNGGYNGGSGTIFKITLEGQITYLAGLSATTGFNPNAKLLLASDGNFYGTAPRGGAYNQQVSYSGTIFKMTPSGTVTTLYSFDQANGGLPDGPLIEGSDGNLYGMTGYGGAGSGGTIFKITKAGTFTLLHSFVSSTGYSPRGGGLVEGTDGNFYGVTMYGGFNSGGVIFKITPQGNYSVVHNFNPVTVELGCNCGLSAPHGQLVLAKDGNFYGVTWYGSSAASTQEIGAIFRMSPAGVVTPIAYVPSGGGTEAMGITEGSDGYLYGTAYSGGADEGGASAGGVVFRALIPVPQAIILKDSSQIPAVTLSSATPIALSVHSSSMLLSVESSCSTCSWTVSNTAVATLSASTGQSVTLQRGTSAGSTTLTVVDLSGVLTTASYTVNTTFGLQSPTKVTVGLNFSCALDSLDVLCWGNLLAGPSLSHPTQLSASSSGSYACAIDDTGVKCWGSGSAVTASKPAMTNPTQISAGADHACAIDATGVKCWGGNAYGQSTVPALSSPTQVSAGYFVTCALDAGGVKCWGDNTFGQTTVPVLTNPTQVAVGRDVACALHAGGVNCWGNATYGLTTMPPLTNPTQISVSVTGICALHAAGVTCWGDNSTGQTNVPAFTDPTWVSAGYWHNCAIDATGVRCWGDDTYGQLIVPQ